MIKNSKHIKLGIIGTAGRGEDIKLLNDKVYYDMIDAVAEQIDILEVDKDCISLVSGGAAWTDHIAVILWLENMGFNGLKLYLPTLWLDISKGGPCYYDNGKEGIDNPGRNANKYHKNFSKMTGLDSLKEIEKAVIAGAILDCNSKGFHERNTKIANECDVLIALTFGTGNEPKEGGTFDTWKKSKASKKIHISINDLLKSKV